MKWVRLENNVVREVIPDEATKPNVAYWYGDDFAAQCKQAPDEVDQRWVYDPETGKYSEPPVPIPPEPQPDYMAFIAGLWEGYNNG